MGLPRFTQAIVQLEVDIAVVLPTFTGAMLSANSH
ncbi:Uncharacterised protein [Yersinia similis]|nr:Uncharacterised protein [Yersinia pseudotuberculosis]CNC63942.1 Uncharacterised protein [Yersinia similis]